MTPIDVAYRAFPGQFTVKGAEIITDFCPFCNGGQGHDKYTFALNVDTGLYNCKRASCGVQGNLKQLCQYFGIPWERKEYELKTKPQKTYKKPTTQMNPITTEIEQYLTKRKFSPKTWKARNISESNNKIVFPYYENRQLVAVKFRARNQEGKWKAFSMEQGGKLIFWGIDNCDAAFPLIITEGEFDALSLDEAGIPNAVSLPNGCNSLGCVDLCWEWLQQFDTYYLWTDRDEGGITARQELIKRLGPAKCMIVEHPKYKDANEVLYREGKDGVVKCISEAKAIPLKGLKDLADLPEYDPVNDVVVPSSIGKVNTTIDGGYRMGEVSIWTGINSSGKSTMLGQELLNAIENGFNICAYSGELPDRIFRYWVDLQAAGPSYIIQEESKGRVITKVDPQMVKHIRSWYRGKFWLYDNQAVATQDEILEVFEYAYRRHGCRVFMVDNLMSLALGSGSESNFYIKQADFIGQCKSFAQRFNVHIHVVAHPRKIKKGEVVGKDDVGGSGNITNWADNVFEVRRLSVKEIATLEEKPEFKGLPIKSTLSILKNRFLGKQDISVFLGFDEKSKRFFPPKDSPNWDYGWVREIGKQSTKDIMSEWNDIGREVFDIE